MKITRRPAHLGFSLVTAVAIVLGAGVSGAAAAPNGPGRSGDAHAEHGHPNPDAVRGHDEEGKRGKGHESHGNGHGYGHGDHHGGEEIVIIDEPAADQPNVDQPNVDQPSVDQPSVDQPNSDQPNVADGGESRDGNPVAQILPENIPSLLDTPAPAPTSQAKSLDPVADADDSFAPAIAPVELRSNVRSSVESGPVSVSTVTLDGSTDGVILRFR